MAALAGIGNMPDTIEDRAVIIGMRRRAPDETVLPYRTRRDGPALADLKPDLHRWVRAHLDQLEAAAPDLPVEDRAADTWEPLVAIADTAGGHWPTNARAAVLALTTDDVDVENVSLRVRLLIDCRTAFGDADGLPSETLVARLRADPEAPWDTLGKNGLNPKSLAGAAPRLRHPLRPPTAGRTAAKPRLQTRPVRRLLAPLLPRPQFPSPLRPSRPSVPRALNLGRQSEPLGRLSRPKPADPSQIHAHGTAGRLGRHSADNFRSRLHQLPPTPQLRRRHPHPPHLQRLTKECKP